MASPNPARRASGAGLHLPAALPVGGVDSAADVPPMPQDVPPRQSVTKSTGKGLFQRLASFVGNRGGDDRPTPIKVQSYWENYDLSFSEAPELFNNDTFQGLSILKQAIDVVVLRLRVKARIADRSKGIRERAAVQIQARIRTMLAIRGLPELKQQEFTQQQIKSAIHKFKRDLRDHGIQISEYKSEDGSLKPANLQPKGNCLSWSKTSIPLTKLRLCYLGYPKTNFPTPAMVARRVKLPNVEQTFVIQKADPFKEYVLVAVKNDRSAIVRGLQALIKEIMAPEAFYFDENGSVLRITNSVFDPRGNSAIREVHLQKRRELYRERQAQIAHDVSTYVADESDFEDAASVREEAVARPERQFVEWTAPPLGMTAESDFEFALHPRFMSTGTGAPGDDGDDDTVDSDSEGGRGFGIGKQIENKILALTRISDSSDSSNSDDADLDVDDDDDGSYGE